MNERYDPEFERLYLKRYPLLFEYARSVLPRDALAEEAVQNAFSIFCKTSLPHSGTAVMQRSLLNILKDTISDTIRLQNEARRILLNYLASCNASISSTIGSVGLEITYDNIKNPEEFQLLKEIAIDKLSCLEMAEKRGISFTKCKCEIERARHVLGKHTAT